MPIRRGGVGTAARCCSSGRYFTLDISETPDDPCSSGAPCVFSSYELSPETGNFQIDGTREDTSTEVNGTLYCHYEQKVRPYIDLIDSLRSLGVDQDLPLPSIAVIGDQSSGKSSVLEALSGVSLPRGSGIVTRCPLELKMKKIRAGEPWKGKLKYRDIEMDLDEPHSVEQEIVKGKQIKYEGLSQNIMAGTGSSISPELISLQIESSEVPDLTLIDLPGIARVAVGNQPKDIGERESLPSLQKEIEVKLQETAAELKKHGKPVPEEDEEKLTFLVECLIEDILKKESQEAEKMLYSQFNMERIVFSQDIIYSRVLSTLKSKQKFPQDADVSVMKDHLNTYFEIASDRLANQIPLIILYHIVNQFGTELQKQILQLIQGDKNVNELLSENKDVAEKRNRLSKRLERLSEAQEQLNKFSV
ncbi:MX1 protein, partial [Polypterus senegalus]